MKKIIFLFCFLIFCVTKIKAQRYTSFIDTNSVWRDVKVICGHSSSFEDYITYDCQEFFNGNIIINQKEYKKLYQTGSMHESYYNHGTSFDSTTYYCNIYLGGLREDSLKQVYFISPNGGETLLYNFNLNVGDSILSNLTNAPPYFYVTNVDSVFIYNKYRRRISFDYNGKIIEGVGNCLWGLLGNNEGFDGNWICNYDHLRDYFYNGIKAYCYPQTYYPHDTSATMLNCFSNGINSFKADEVDVVIYPNPANSVIQIKTSNRLMHIILFDVLGKEVLSTQEKNIDISALNEGVYFVQVKTAEGVLTRKIIVQHRY